MNSAQQIIGVNDRLGNPAVANMQGTTRAIYDIASGVSNNYTFFQNVQTRPYPFSNISQNRFEVGESLAIESIALLTFVSGAALAPNQNFTNFLAYGQNAPLLNLYIGNQRVIKDLDLSYCLTTLGTTNANGVPSDENSCVFRLETPIVIPPQIEFYATLQFASNVGTAFASFGLVLQGTGTLLNPKSNF